MEKTIYEIIQEKLDNDSEFQGTLTNLSDEEKTSSIESRRKELLTSEFKTLSEKALKSEKNEELAKNFKVRAEKVEEELKKLKPETKKSDDNSLSTKDFYALTNAKVPEEDIDEVIEYSKFKGISVAEALKLPTMKTVLYEKSETRRTAQATQTRHTRPANNVSDGYSLIKDIESKGEDSIPDAGSKEAEAIFWARRNRKPM
jgi:hypothetical protein